MHVHMTYRHIYIFSYIATTAGKSSGSAGKSAGTAGAQADSAGQLAATDNEEETTSDKGTYTYVRTCVV